MPLRLDDLGGIPTPLADRLEDFLDHLIAPTVGRLARDERERLRDETRAHILGYWEDFVRGGETNEHALELALREFGEPRLVGARFVAERAEGRPDEEARRVLRQTGQRAFATFGLAASANLALLQFYLVPAYPEESWLPYLCIFFLVSPLVAGGACGMGAPGRLSRGVSKAVLGVALCLLPAGLALLPNRLGLVLAALVPLVWLPLGLIAAGGSASLVRDSRGSAFWRVEE